MRIVDPAQLDPHPDVESVLTAAMPPYVMATLSAAMKDVDQLDAPGPAKIAALETNLGSTLFVVYHEEQTLLEILAPLDEHVIDNLTEVVSALRLPATAIDWVHPSLSQTELLKRAILPPRTAVVFENHVVAQRLLLELLQNNGYSTLLASSIHDLEEVFASTPPDAIFIDCDAVGPGVDLARIRQLVAAHSKDIPVLVFGETGTDLDHQQGYRHPAETLTTASLLDALAGAHSKVN